ncbi:ATP-binding protein [Mycolicibacterium fluoranthenivorans]|uniref:ATP-binding protein n=1 Tax=Mycolicibacterium fluoranthenivorans TaxID=258505 RepID=A0A7G8P6T6_9MYCO|nr:ATP-binding protein [Mycolicibacterium fluoranthenivorans]QNJ90052.1 ATP-binding protein [Mycolicibacterium fluoranthenivorans]
MWGWSEAAVANSVFAETGDAIDDLQVWNSDGCRAYIQAKYRVQLDTGATSPLAKTLNQFVAQYVNNGKSNQDCERFVLATSSESSAPIRIQLPDILSRVKALPNGDDMMKAAKNQSETNTLNVVVDHLKAALKSETKTDPLDTDVRAILETMRVTIFDLYDDQNSLREAQSILRTTVLQEPDEAASVWGHMISLTARFSIMQTGADLRWLQNHLNSIEVSLRAVQSYRSDVEKLISYSRKTIDDLSGFSTIPGNQGAALTLRRRASDELNRALADGSIIVTGDPGAGKSACIYEVANALEDGEFVALSADALNSGSLGDLRNELALDHDLLQVIQNWPSSKTGPYLLVDALDAARGDQTQKALLDLIRETRKYADGWNVAVSVRRFDLRYNFTLQSLFDIDETTTRVDEFQSGEFSNIRHFCVPILTDAELDQLEALSPELHAAATGGTEKLKTLVRIPFNLRLLADLVSANVNPTELEPIVTQLQLLNKYWQHRVLTPAPADSREAVLRAACSDMLDTKSMQISRGRLLSGAGFPEPIEGLLSNRVLTEHEAGSSVDRDQISFSHHVLFDYAVSRLLLRGTEADLLETALAHRGLVLLARPSYDMHFRYLWESNADRHAFWSLVLTLEAAPELPKITKIIGPSIAASDVQDQADLQPLFDALDEQSERRVGAELALRHLVSARLGGEGRGQQIPPERRAVWCKTVRILGQNVRDETAFAVLNLLNELSANAKQLDDEQLQDLGAGARKLLKWAQDRGVVNRHLLRVATTAVVRTFSTDPDASEKLMRDMLTSERLAEFGYLEMPALADAVEGLSDARPDLIGEIYAAAFGFAESSEDATTLSSGVVGLTSNRRQDYEHAYFALAEFFPKFLEISPRDAVTALAATLRAYHRKDSLRAVESFEVDWIDKQVSIEADVSSIWSIGDLYDHDEPVKMLNAFTDWLTLQVDSGGSSAATEIVDLLRDVVCPASIWRRVFVVATQSPEAFTVALEPMCRSTTALASSDLSDAIDQFLRVAFPLFAVESRQRIEKAIIELPGTAAS